MNQTSGSLTVFFEEPFWVGIFELISDGKLSVCRIVFGAEPKDHEVREFILKHYFELNLSTAVRTEVRHTADNPKRRQRNAGKQMHNIGIGTKSQQALKKQREEMKTENIQKSRKRRFAEKQRKFELKQKKHKEKHRGH